MIKVIVFDFDGVLVESMGLKTQAFARLFAAEGEKAVADIVSYHLRNGGVSRFDKFRYIYRSILGRPLSETDFNGLCRRFAELVLDAVVAAPYVEGTVEFLESRGKDYRLFVASATPEGELVSILERRGMLGYFEGVYGAPTSKTKAMSEILDLTGILPAEAIFVGDALSDRAAAVANGVRFVARVEGTLVFEGIDCVKIADLTGLATAIELLQKSATYDRAPRHQRSNGQTCDTA